MTEKIKHQIVIIGSGTGGLSTAARLIHDYPEKEWDIAIIDPSEKHYYQPLWTLVGAGVFPKEESERDTADYIPFGATWIKQKVTTFQPEQNSVTLDNGTTVEYDYLIVAAGIQMDWHKIKGCEETLGKNGVTSNYIYELSEYTWENLRNLKKGNAVFTQPPMPIKCAGAPQKIVYMAEHYLEKQGLKDQVDITFCITGPGIFGVPKYKAALEKVLQRKKLEPKYEHELIEIKGEEKIAVFKKVGDGTTVEIKFDMLHVVPPMSAPDFIKQSPLADAGGWVEVDMYSTQHVRYPNVFSCGDCSSMPTSRTGAAIRKQVPVLVKNLVAHMDGKVMNAKYDGYASCPLVTGYGTCIIAEFDYDGNIAESFPFDQAQERFSMYMLKAYALPRLYWHGMLKGRA